MPITGGFGDTYDFRTGRARAWYMRRDGVKRWADNDEPVEGAEPVEQTDTRPGDRPDA